MARIRDKSLYLVISRKFANGKKIMDIAKSAISGGVDIIQLREKDMPAGELVDIATDMSRLCRENGVIFIVNDDPDIAVRSGAAGVHLGQEDIKRHDLHRVRDLLGPEGIIGLSTHSLEQFRAAESTDIDYIAYGPIFPTKTKDYYIGAGDVTQVASGSMKPVFFIGGIDLDNIGTLISKGASNIALIRGMLGADDIAARTREFKNRIEKT